MEVRRYVYVRRTDELLEILQVYELVIEDDILVDFVLLGEDFQAEPVRFAVFPQFVWMCGAEDNVDDFGELRQNLGQRIEHKLDTFVRREQAEREQHHPPLHAELVLEIGWIDESDVVNPVRDEIDLGRRGLVDFLEHPPSALGHDHKPGGERDHAIHHALLIGVRFAQHRMKRCDNGHPQLAQKRQNVTAGRAAENAELMLQADDVHVADVEESPRREDRTKGRAPRSRSEPLRVFIAAGMSLTDTRGTGFRDARLRRRQAGRT